MKATKSEIHASNVKLKKSLGQNFLKDRNIVEKIVKTANVDNTTHVIEIGPGIGALTELLINECNTLTAVELDDELIPVLNESFGVENNFSLIHSDFLKVDKKLLANDEALQTKVVANLPYYITSAIITKILNEMDFVDEIYIMVQKEVAERICANPKTKQYGSLSVYCQLMCDVKYEFTVKKSVFIPEPKVDSAIISLKRNELTTNIAQVEKFIKNCFKQKRKTLVNNLNKAYGVEKEYLIQFLLDAGFKATVRAEEISPRQYIQLHEKFVGVINDG